MSALETVEDYIDDARVLLVDTIEPFRYDDPSLLQAFNVTLLEARRLRADLFIYTYGSKVPKFTSVDSSPVKMEDQFRLALVYGLTGHAIQRDQEDVQDNRATTYMDAFTQMLTGVKPERIQGGTPNAKGKQA